ncbi:archease [Halococcus dombrowskii]|uniref:Archease n=1 Tax=Halococcus dombrowskii TaxID=179637 RepID=A0AAV3SF65_HALDO|nr:archease [Halococcus dombrowskii]UOO94917.1 archease [Halococcus dombrowskii]
MSFELREHTADVAVAADGKTLDEAFGAVADGLAAAMCEAIPDDGDRFSFAVQAENREALLYEYLADCIYQRDVRGVLPVENRATVDRTDDGWRLDASARGVPLSAIDAREVKAVTYSEMRIEQDSDGWNAYVVFDV